MKPSTLTNLIKGMLLALLFSLPFASGTASAESNNNSYVAHYSESTQWGPVVSSWTVPPNPIVNNGQFLAFWPAISGTKSILQPVLVWQQSTAAWSIASWNCCIGNPYYSSSIPVRPGDAIFSSMMPQCATGTTDCQTWKVTTVNLTSGNSTTLTTNVRRQLLDAFYPAFLETQTQTSCYDLPGNRGVTFITYAFDNKLSKLSPAWENGYDAHDPSGPVQGLPCGWTQSISGDKFTLGYNSGSPASQNFLLEGSAPKIALIRGGSASFTVAVRPQNGFSGSALLASYGLPSGVTATFSSSSTSSTSVVTLRASGSAATGVFPVAISARAGSLGAGAPLLLTVK